MKPIFDIPISNHPYIDTIQRTVSLCGDTTRILRNNAEFTFLVKHWVKDSNDAYLHSEKMDITINMYPDNTEQVPIDELGNTMGDFDILIAMIEADTKTYKTIITEQLQYMDSIGRIDQKCNYQIPE